MLVVRVEIWPGGYEPGKREIARMNVGNISDLADTSDYIATLEEYGNERLGIPKSKSTVQVTGHTRRSTVWSLIRKILEKNDG